MMQWPAPRPAAASSRKPRNITFGLQGGHLERAISKLKLDGDWQAPGAGKDPAIGSDRED
jgi:hypothetical protein